MTGIHLRAIERANEELDCAIARLNRSRLGIGYVRCMWTCIDMTLANASTQLRAAFAGWDDELFG